MTQELDKVKQKENSLTEEKTSKKDNLAKETFVEFMRSLLIGGIPTGLDYLFSALVFFFFCLQAMGYSFLDTFTIESGTVTSGVSAAGTAVGYFMGFIASYLLSVFFVFKHNKKGKSLKGILIYISIEIFIYGFNIFLGYMFLKVLSYTPAFIARIVISYIIVFLLRKFFIFMPDKNSQENEEIIVKR